MAAAVIDKLKDNVRELSRRTRGRRLEQIVAELGDTLLGWKAYFGITEAEPSARAGQVDSAQVTLLRMEAMGIQGLPRAAQAWRVRARGMERQQERAWPVANIEDPGTVGGDADAFVQRAGPATTGTRQGLMRMHSTQRTAVYVTRTHGGVGVRGREVPSCPD